MMSCPSLSTTPPTHTHTHNLSLPLSNLIMISMGVLLPIC